MPNFSLKIPLSVTVWWLTGLCLAFSQNILPTVSVDQGTQVEWHTVVDRTYQLQQRGNDDPDEWQNLGEPVVGTNRPETFVDQVIGQQYRVIEQTQATPVATNALVNGGFESGSETDLVGWTLSSSIHSRYAADSHSGAYSLRTRIENEGSTPGHGLLTQQVSSAGGSIQPGKTYHLMFWAKQVSFGPSYVQFYEVQWLNADGAVILATGYQAFEGGANQWARISSEPLTAPTNAADAKIEFFFATGSVEGGHGEVLLDDLALEAEGLATNSDGGETIIESSTKPVLVLSWPTQSGAEYQPQISTDLSKDNWNPLAPVVGDGGTHSIVLPIEGERAFFQLVMSDTTESPSTGIITPLFDESTPLEPDLQEDTGNALVTYLADRARDRHAREDLVGGVVFRRYDHYLSFYWEQRMANIEIIDRVAKGGDSITFNFTTEAKLNPAEFRTFYADNDFVAQYHVNMSDNLNAGVTYLGSSASERYPGETNYHYTATIDRFYPDNRPLQTGDRIEVELSQFLLEPRNGRSNYYGTAFLYVVGEGVLPWYAKYKEEATDGPSRDNASFDSYPLPIEAWLGGLTTLPYQYSNEPEHRFKQTAGNISPTNGQEFMFGRRLHHTDFDSGAHSEPNNPDFLTHAGKLGPQYVAASCVECHVNNGRALPVEIGAPLLQSVVKVGRDAAGSPHLLLGDQLQPKDVFGPAEAGVTLTGYSEVAGQYGDGTPYTLRKPVYEFSGVVPDHFSVRIAPPLVGLGLLEAVPEETIAQLADPDDADGDGLSGRMAVVPDLEDPTVSRLGRFGYKAAQATVSYQIAAALNRDMGVRSRIFPMLDGESAPGNIEIEDAELDQMNRYVSLLGVSARRNLTDEVALRGETLFEQMNCVSCHTPELKTSPHHPMAELRNQTIRPYTDLLLHDMGSGLADNMGEKGASGAEWRTAPLWNIGLTEGVSGGEAYLHDGRARTLEEAILWHGGEGAAAKEAFRNLPATDREAVIQFLRSL